MPFSENRKLRPRAARSGAPKWIYALVSVRSECLWICVARSEAPHTQIAAIEVVKSQNFDMPFSENRKLRPRAARSGAPKWIYALVSVRSECLWICVARSEAPHTQITAIEVTKL